MGQWNLSDEQDKTIARLTRLLEDRNEEIEELKKKLQKTEHQRSSFWAVLAGLGLNPGRTHTGIRTTKDALRATFQHFREEDPNAW